MTTTTTEGLVATLSVVAYDYDLSPTFVTTDFSGEPVEVDTVVVRRWSKGDDGQPYTAIDVSGYRLTKTGNRKGIHGLLYLGLNAEEDLAAAVGAIPEA